MSEQEQVRPYKLGDPVADGDMPVQAEFHPLNATRVCMRQLEDPSKVLNYVVFRNCGEPDDPLYKEVRELTGATTNNLWYRITDEEMRSETDLQLLRMLEQMLRFYDERPDARSSS